MNPSSFRNKQKRQEKRKTSKCNKVVTLCSLCVRLQDQDTLLLQVALLLATKHLWLHGIYGSRRCSSAHDIHP